MNLKINFFISKKCLNKIQNYSNKIIFITFTLPVNITSYVNYHENFDVKL